MPSPSPDQAPCPSTTSPLVVAASHNSVYGLFSEAARLHPGRLAIVEAGKQEKQATYLHLLQRVDQLACALKRSGIRAGDRLALLSENRTEFLEVILAAGKLGACVACQNWRLKPAELEHCLTLVEPLRIFVSARHCAAIADCMPEICRTQFGEQYEQFLGTPKVAHSTQLAEAVVDPESALLILYTSGTTGLPKGAVLSHRAEIFRNLVVRAEFGVSEHDTFVAWSPLYHMGAAECSLGALMTGGKVITLEGFDASKLASIVASEPLGWLLLMPGMVGRFADELERREVQPRGVKLCGVMADLVPPSEIARITRLLQAPFANTFGATETGCPPCSSNRIPIGVTPQKLSKDKSPFCEIRLVDEHDCEVPPGSPGQLCIRGLTLFSGYFRADAANAEEFRNGWFHMGDVFIQNSDGSLDFVDRVKYLIKSGGENIYPAEIERVLLSDPQIEEAAVVRRPDERWGEVPVAFVTGKSPNSHRSGQAALRVHLFALCREKLAGYKQPKDLFFISASEFPRSASGKIQRHELEKVLESSSCPEPTER